MIEQIEAQTTSGDRAGEVFSISYEMPQTLQEAVEKFGEDVVYSQFKGSLVINIQSIMRNAIKKDNATAASVQEAVDKWGGPRMRAPARPLSERVDELLGRMSPEDRAALLSQYVEDEG